MKNVQNLTIYIKISMFVKKSPVCRVSQTLGFGCHLGRRCPEISIHGLQWKSVKPWWESMGTLDTANGGGRIREFPPKTTKHSGFWELARNLPKTWCWANFFLTQTQVWLKRCWKNSNQNNHSFFHHHVWYQRFLVNIFKHIFFRLIIFRCMFIPESSLSHDPGSPTGKPILYRFARSRRFLSGFIIIQKEFRHFLKWWQVATTSRVYSYAKNGYLFSCLFCMWMMKCVPHANR